MSSFTYEYENNKEALETFEWDNTWWDHANVEGVPRVLYIGDSISCTTRIACTREAKEEIFFDGFGTSKALDNPYFKESVRIFKIQQGERKAVLFNNGLHGWHLKDETEYKEQYEKMIVFLLEEFKGTPLILLLTTSVSDKERDKRVVKRNKAVWELAEKYKLPVLDFYTIVKNQGEDIFSDGVHLKAEGYSLLAKEIVEKIRQL